MIDVIANEVPKTVDITNILTFVVILAIVLVVSLVVVIRLYKKRYNEFDFSKLSKKINLVHKFKSSKEATAEMKKIKKDMAGISSEDYQAFKDEDIKNKSSKK